MKQVIKGGKNDIIMKDYADKKDETSLSFLQRITRFIGMQNSKPFF